MKPRRIKRKEKFIINKVALEDMLLEWWSQIDEKETTKIDIETYDEIEQIAVMVVLEFIGKMVNYCDIKDYKLTSDEIHNRICNKLQKERQGGLMESRKGVSR